MMMFPAALGLLFIALKLMGVIAWSWWLVLLPLYLLPALGMLCFAVAGAIWLTLSKEQKARHRARTALEKYADALKRRF